MKESWGLVFWCAIFIALAWFDVLLVLNIVLLFHECAAAGHSLGYCIMS